MGHFPRSRKCHNRTHAPRQTSRRAFPAISFVYLSVERPFNKFYGINCHPKLGAKLLDRFFHWRRQVSPPVNNLTHRFFDGSQHFLYCNITVGSRHRAVASSSGGQAAEQGLAMPLQNSCTTLQQASSSVGSPRQYLRTKGSKPQFPNGIVSSVSFVSTTNTARSLAGFDWLALALTPWRSPGSSEKLCPAL